MLRTLAPWVPNANHDAIPTIHTKVEFLELNPKRLPPLYREVNVRAACCRTGKTAAWVACWWCNTKCNPGSQRSRLQLDSLCIQWTSVWLPDFSLSDKLSESNCRIQFRPTPCCPFCSCCISPVGSGMKVYCSSELEELCKIQQMCWPQNTWPILPIYYLIRETKVSSSI